MSGQLSAHLGGPVAAALAGGLHEGPAVPADSLHEGPAVPTDSLHEDPAVPTGPGWRPLGGGACGQLVRDFDWSATSLGPMAVWPACLRSTVELVLNSPIAMVLMWGPQHIMIYNDGYAVIAGGRHPAALGGSVPLIWPEVWDWNQAVLAAGFRGEARQHLGAHLVLERHGEPEDAWFDLYYTPVRDGSQVGGVLGTVVEISGRKQAEQALRTSQDRMAAIFGQASVGLAELSLDGRFGRVNGALCQMLGRCEEELLTLRMDDIIHPQDMAENRQRVARLVAEGVPFTLEKRYRKPDESWVWVSSSMSRLDDEQGRPLALIAVKTDITERRRVEVALRDLNDTLEQRVGREIAERDKAEAALRQSQKMEAVGQLTGGVAHDFNNVLQIISGSLQMLAQQLGDDAGARKRLGMAVAAVERGAKLSSQLLAFARRQPLQPVVADLGRLVANMDELLRRALGEAIDIVTVSGSGLWNTLVDPGQIENVILNLAINARDAMGGAGRLTIELGNAVLDEYYVNKLPDLPSGQYVLLAVSDTGCGMPPEVLERAFEPFYTTKAEGEGTGLGLSMAYGFVKQSRGHIKIVSEPGKGTTVRIYLPRSMQAATPEAPEAPASVAGGSETVLVVEDDAGVRGVVVDMLQALGYRVLQAEHAERALQVLREDASIELLFTDVVMPGPLRSTELARRARAALPDLAVLFTSGYPQDAIVHGGRLDAGVELLSKPYKREDLARKLRQVLHARRQAMQQRLRQEQADQHRLLPPQPATPHHGSLRVLVVEDNPDSLEMVCELVGMLGHTVTGIGDGERAWALLEDQGCDILFTDVSLPGISGIELARRALRGGRARRIIFSTGYGKEALEQLDFSASLLRKPYDLADLQAALDMPL